MKQNGGCGTTAGWKTSPYVHLLLGGKPRSSCTPHSMTSRARSENKLKLCSFGLNVFTFITTIYLPTIKNKPITFDHHAFALTMPILHPSYFWSSCGRCNESDPLPHQLLRWNKINSFSFYFIVSFNMGCTYQNCAWMEIYWKHCRSRVTKIKHLKFACAKSNAIHKISNRTRIAER